MDDDIIEMRMRGILEYKERINQNVKEIIELINEPERQKIKLNSDILLRNSLMEPIVRNEVEIRKKTADIHHCISCIGTLWREDKAPKITDFISSSNSLFTLCFNMNPPDMRKIFLEEALKLVNSLVLPIHGNKKWEVLIEIETLLAKIKTRIRSPPRI